MGTLGILLMISCVAGLGLHLARQLKEEAEVNAVRVRQTFAVFEDEVDEDTLPYSYLWKS